MSRFSQESLRGGRRAEGGGREGQARPASAGWRVNLSHALRGAPVFCPAGDAFAVKQGCRATGVQQGEQLREGGLRQHRKGRDSPPRRWEIDSVGANKQKTRG